MSIPPKIQPLLYGLGVFVVFTVLSLLLKIITNHKTNDAEYFGILSNKDLFIGAVVGIIVTFTHEQKKKLK